MTRRGEICHHLIVKISINLKAYLKIAFREKMTKYLEEGASLSRPSASDRTVNLFDQNKTVNQRWTELIKWAGKKLSTLAERLDFFCTSLPGGKRSSSMALCLTSRSNCSRQIKHEY